MSTDVRIPWLIFVYLLIGVFAAGYGVGVGANTYEPVSSIPRDVPPAACLCTWDCYCGGECGGTCNCCGVGPAAAPITE